MTMLQEMLSEFIRISKTPKSSLDLYLKQGKKVIGCMPYFCPEELVHAAGMVPIGLWGAQTQVSEARRYLPAFICSIVQTTLEIGIRGGYAGLSAVMIPILCDSLKSMDGNWRYGVTDIPVIPVAHAQNRKTKAGVEFTASQYRKIKTKLEEISKKPVTDDGIRNSISIYKKRNAAIRRFMDELYKRPGMIAASERNAVFKSGYFMDAVDYTEKIESLADYLASSPDSDANGLRVVTCGVIADNTGLLNILDECGVSIVDDIVAHESLRYRYDVPETSDPFEALAMQIGLIEGCPFLYDLGKKRAELLVDIVRQRSADGVLFVMTKFCDPDEYDIVPLKKALDKNGIRSMQIEVDQQIDGSGRMRTAIETFCEIANDRSISP